MEAPTRKLENSKKTVGARTRNNTELNPLITSSLAWHSNLGQTETSALSTATSTCSSNATSISGGQPKYITNFFCICTYNLQCKPANNFFPDQGICQSRFNVHQTRGRSVWTHFFARYYNRPSAKFRIFCFKLNVIN